MSNRRARPVASKAAGRRYVTVAFIAFRLDVSEKTVRKWIGAGALKAARFGGSWRILEADLLAFEERNQFAPVDSPTSPSVSL